MTFQTPDETRLPELHPDRVVDLQPSSLGEGSREHPAAMDLDTNGMRIWEPGFRVCKSVGWPWHRTRRVDLMRMDRHRLVVAETTGDWTRQRRCRLCFRAFPRRQPSRCLVSATGHSTSGVPACAKALLPTQPVVVQSSRAILPRQGMGNVSIPCGSSIMVNSESHGGYSIESSRQESTFKRSFPWLPIPKSMKTDNDYNVGSRTL